jgi:hypothetical protein
MMRLEEGLLPSLLEEETDYEMKKAFRSSSIVICFFGMNFSVE